MLPNAEGCITFPRPISYPVKKTARRRESSCSSRSLGISYTQMATSNDCDECRALAQDLREAYADASSDQAVRDAWLATQKMIGGTEEDAQRAEELLKALPRTERYDTRIPNGLFLVNPKLRKVFRNMALHFARTGHSVRLPDF